MHSKFSQDRNHKLNLPDVNYLPASVPITRVGSPRGWVDDRQHENAIRWRGARVEGALFSHGGITNSFT